MSKERYEYERQQLEYIKEWFNKQEDAPYMEITYEYFISLIEWAEERLRLLKRVQEMEDKSIKHEARINNLTFDLAVSRAQNKRYREAIEEIAEAIPITYEHELELSRALIRIADIIIGARIAIEKVGNLEGEE